MKPKVIIALIGGLLCLVFAVGMVPENTNVDFDMLHPSLSGITTAVSGLPPMCLICFGLGIGLFILAMYFKYNEDQ